MARSGVEYRHGPALIALQGDLLGNSTTVPPLIDELVTCESARRGFNWTPYCIKFKTIYVQRLSFTFLITPVVRQNHLERFRRGILWNSGVHRLSCLLDTCF